MRVVLYVGNLNSGGAERQHCNLAIGLRDRGHAVRIVTALPLTGEDGHYAELLHARGIDVVHAGAAGSQAAEQALLRMALDDGLVTALPLDIRDNVLDLMGELLTDPPDVLHCTLDYPNVIGGAAGLLAHVPRIVLSTRNVNPSPFWFYRPWMDNWYRFLARFPHVSFIANSRHGGRDYARWMGVEGSRLEVVLNGVDLAGLPRPTLSDVARLREELGLTPSHRLVAGIFRLSSEKQPFVFLDVVERVAREIPEVRIALCGIGTLWDEVRKAATRPGLEGRLFLLGQRKDVPVILSAADCLLLASAFEGTPNVVLEAQWFGCPVVATAVGGTPDALQDGVTGFLHGPDDAAEMARSVVRILRDPRLRETMGAAGRRLVEERFSMDRMVEQTLTLYRRGRPWAPPGSAYRATVEA